MILDARLANKVAGRTAVAEVDTPRGLTWSGMVGRNGQGEDVPPP
jgi:hypothetical protein